MPEPERPDDTTVPGQQSDPVPAPPIRGAREVQDDRDEAPAARDGADALQKFLWFHPFTRFYSHLADLQGSAPTQHERFAALRRKDKALYRVCVGLDLLLTFVASVALLATAVFLVWNTLWEPNL